MLSERGPMGEVTVRGEKRSRDLIKTYGSSVAVPMDKVQLNYL